MTFSVISFPISTCCSRSSNLELILLGHLINCFYIRKHLFTRKCITMLIVGSSKCNVVSYFVEGKNKGLEGLAAAILKLWEKSLVAKIAVKVGIPDTNNELMACELKASCTAFLLCCFRTIAYF